MMKVLFLHFFESYPFHGLVTKEKNRKVPKGEQKKQDKLIEKMKEELKVF